MKKKILIIPLIVLCLTGCNLFSKTTTSPKTTTAQATTTSKNPMTKPTTKNITTTKNTTTKNTQIGKKYTITYDPNGGAIKNTSIEVEYAKSFTLEVPTKTGAVFLGWQYDSKMITDNKGNATGTGIYSYKSDITVKAIWDVQSYKINYDADGGTVTPAYARVYTGDNYTLSIPEKAGYTFDGWYDKTLTTKYTDEVGKCLEAYAFTSDLNVKAKWVINNYKITLDADGGRLTNTEINVDYDTSYKLEVPKKDGYTFTNWYDEKTGTIYTDENGNCLENYNNPSNITLKAAWTNNRYRVDLNPNGVEYQTEFFIAYYGKPFSIVPPEKSGYTFVGWFDETLTTPYTLSTGESIKDYDVLGPITLKAKWSSNPDTKYVTNYYLEALDGTYGIPYTTREFSGYTNTLVEPEEIKFNGFQLQEYTKVVIKEDNSTVVNLYYNRIEYELKLNADEGIEVKGAGKYKYGQSVTIEAEATSGIAFTQWICETNNVVDAANPKYTFSFPAGAVIFKASSSAKTYNIKCYENGGSCPTMPKTYTLKDEIVLPDATKDYYTFDGWYNLDFSVKYTKLTGGDVSLYAKYTPITYTITYHLNEGETHSGENITTYSVSTNSFILNGVTKQYYDFEGWYLDETNRDEKYKIDTIYLSSIVSKYPFLTSYNLDLYPNFTEKKYTITYVTNGGTMYSTTQNYYATDGVVELYTPTYDGHYFNGWEYNGGYIASLDATIRDDVTLYASWLDNNFVYITGDDIAMIVGYDGTLVLKDGILEIPERIFGYVVTGISSAAQGYTMIQKSSKLNYTGFSGNTDIKGFEFPDTLQKITSDAFMGCSGIEELTLPESLTEIYDRAFANCTGLKVLRINSVIDLKNVNVFYNCKNIKKIVSKDPDHIAQLAFSGDMQYDTEAPTPVYGIFDYTGAKLYVESEDHEAVSITLKATKTIPDYAFYKCSQLVTVKMNRIVTIGENAFDSCTNLETITFGSLISTIKENAFKNTTSLQKVNIDSIDSFAGINFSNTNSNPILQTKKPWLYVDGVAVSKDLVINSTQIGDYAFYNTDVTSLTIGPNVRTIGCNSFYNTDIKTFTIDESTSSSKLYSIGEEAFYFCSSLENIYLKTSSGNKKGLLPETVYSIGDHAFGDCVKLETIALNSGLSLLGEEAFYGCEMLYATNLSELVDLQGIEDKALEIYNTYDERQIVAQVGDYWVHFDSAENAIGLLAYVGSETSITLPSKMTLNSIEYKQFSIGSYNRRFVIGEDVTSINMPNNVTKIYDFAFADTKIKSINIPYSVTSIGENAFYHCSSLESLVINANITEIPTAMCSCCEKLSSLEITANFTSIGAEAFRNCCRITIFVLPSNLTSIGSNAFQGCSKLSMIINNSNMSLKLDSAQDGYVASYAEFIGSGEIIVDSTTHSKYAYSDTNTYSYKALFLIEYNYDNYYAHSNRIELADAIQVKTDNGSAQYLVEGIASGSFKNEKVDTITRIDLPKSLKYIGMMAFSGFSLLSQCSPGTDGADQFVLPSTIINIDKYAFYQCTSLYNVFFQENTSVSISEYAFYGCSKLEIVNLPNTVAFLGKYAFGDCTNLYSVRGFTDSSVNINLSSIGTYAFRGAFRKDSVSIDLYISTNIRTISDGAFIDCKSITSLTVGKSNSSSYLATIGAYAFEGCLNMTSVTFNNTNLTKIDACAFKDCISLLSVELPSTIRTVGDRAFYNCDSLTTFTATNATTLGRQMIGDCPSITTLTLPFFGGNSTDTSGVERVFGYIFSTDSSSMLSLDAYQITLFIDGEYYKFFLPYTLKTVTIINESRVINGAFCYTKSITTLNISGTLNLVESGAICYNSDLTTLTFNKNMSVAVKRIKSMAICYNDALSTVTFGGGATLEDDAIQELVV